MNETIASGEPVPKEEEVPGNLPVPPGFKLLKVLGRGGMGAVYSARQEDLDRTVILKYLTVSDPAFRERFQKEARILSKLSHPGIMGVHAFFVIEDKPILVAEFVAGKNLAQVLSNGGPMSIEKAVRTMIPVLAALDHAHESGVIHRDLKTENLMITGTGEVKIADFGIAACRDPELDLTRAGVIMGTPAYMAPEQAEGRMVDLRADLYAVGIIFHELLTGGVPFRDPSHMRVLQMHRTERPPRLDALLPAVPVALADLVEACLAKDPAGRPSSAGDVKLALEALGLVAAPPRSRALTGRQASGRSSARTTGAAWAPSTATGSAAATSLIHAPRWDPWRTLGFAAAGMAGLALIAGLRFLAITPGLATLDPYPRIRGGSKQGLQVELRLDPPVPVEVRLAATGEPLRRVGEGLVFEVDWDRFQTPFEVEVRSTGWTRVSTDRVTWDLATMEEDLFLGFHQEIFEGRSALDLLRKMTPETDVARRYQGLAHRLMVRLAVASRDEGLLARIENAMSGAGPPRKEPLPREEVAIQTLAGIMVERWKHHAHSLGPLLERRAKEGRLDVVRKLYESILPLRILDQVLAALKTEARTLGAGDWLDKPVALRKRPSHYRPKLKKLGDWHPAYGDRKAKEKKKREKSDPDGDEEDEDPGERSLYYLYRPGAFSPRSAETASFLVDAIRNKSGETPADMRALRVIEHEIPFDDEMKPPEKRLIFSVQTRRMPQELLLMAPSSFLWVELPGDWLVLLDRACMEDDVDEDEEDVWISHQIPVSLRGTGVTFPVRLELESIMLDSAAVPNDCFYVVQLQLDGG